MRRFLVVCCSRGGTTLELASTLAERCGADLELIKDKVPREGLLGWLRPAFEALLRRQPWIRPTRRQPGEYGLVIIGTPVWAGRVASPVCSCLARQQGRLRRVAFSARTAVPERTRCWQSWKHCAAGARGPPWRCRRAACLPQAETRNCRVSCAAWQARPTQRPYPALPLSGHTDF